MKVLLHNRDPKLWTGGDAIQVENTLKALKAIGVDADFTSDTFSDPSEYDLVHIFHVNFFWVTPMIEKCIEKNIPYVISPIYFDQEFDNSFSIMRRLLENAKSVLALSDREKKELSRFGLKNVEVVSNGVDKDIFKPMNKKSEYALWVGRTSDPTKGAHFAIRACQELGKKLITVGSSNNTEYSTYCNNNSFHVEYMDQNQLSELYAQASVYICSSLSERQSLGVLEAAACGTSIVDSIFNRGADLLESSVIVDPRENEQIKTAIQKQWGIRNTDNVPSWEDVALKIKDIYER